MIVITKNDRATTFGALLPGAVFRMPDLYRPCAADFGPPCTASGPLSSHAVWLCVVWPDGKGNRAASLADGTTWAPDDDEPAVIVQGAFVEGAEGL